MTAKQFTKYILHKNGIYRQCIKAIEEMSELTHVLARYTFDGEFDREHLAEELSDVVLMMRELAEAFDISDLEIEERIQGKINRYCGYEQKGVKSFARENESLEHTAEG